MESISIVLIFASLAFLLGFLSLLYFYIKLIKKLEAQEKELRKHYLKKARTEGTEIVKEAGQEAISILTNSRIVSEQDQTILDEIVKKITQDQTTYLKASVDQLMQEFTAQLQQIKNNNINTLTNVSEDIEKHTKSQINDYVKVIEQETVTSEKTVNKKIEDEYKLVQGEIAAYKAEQLKKIDANLSGLLQQISTEVLEKSISPQDHTDLILKTLEKAKSENLFVN